MWFEMVDVGVIANDGNEIIVPHECAGSKVAKNLCLELDRSTSLIRHTIKRF